MNTYFIEGFVKTAKEKDLTTAERVGLGLSEYGSSLSNTGLAMGGVAGHAAGKYITKGKGKFIPRLLSGLAAVKGGEVLGEHGLGGMYAKNLQKAHDRNYKGAKKELNKKASIQDKFIEGFAKVAKLSEDQSDTSATHGVHAMLPFGTTISTAFGKRPKGHSRMGEFAKRVGGATVGGLAGLGVGMLTKNVNIANAMGTVGAIGGEAVGSHYANKKHYDKNGKLKKDIKQS